MSRIEKDFLGELQIPDTAYYGVQSLRGQQNFHITGLPISNEPNLIKAFGYVKKACAMANKDLDVLAADKADAIAKACDKLIAGEFLDQFIIDYIQGGAGTSTNMNANEVIANVALEIMGKPKGDYATINPNDHVNCSQSTNDTYPSALKLAFIMRAKEYIVELKGLQSSLLAKAKEFDAVLKMGRTHLQDAVPMSLGAEFHGWATTIGEEVTLVEDTLKLLMSMNMGATAIGTCVNTPNGYPQLITKYLAELTKLPITLAPDLVEATSDTTDMLQLSSVMKRTAVKLTKICNDLRMLASGPRTGLGEILLPQMQPGSSIMPGKVNPVIPEVVNQSCFYVIGLDTTAMLASSGAQLQLNVMEPVIGFALFQQLTIMQNAVSALSEKCIKGIKANQDHTAQLVMNSLGIVTQLSPILGYKVCAEIAKEGFEQNKSLHDIVVVERKLITQEKWDEVFSFENLIHPKFIKS